MTQSFKQKTPGKSAGVDGGVLKKRYSAGDVAAARAVAAILDYTASELETSYIPGKKPEPDFRIFESGNDQGLEQDTEALRLQKEVSVAVKAVDQADKVFMDGSIVPSYSKDESVLEKYNQLYRSAEKGCLIGVVEDSYGLKMSEVLEERLGLEIGRVRDTLLMDAILEEGERSFVRRYSESPVEHPVLQKLEEKQVNNLFTFYVKLSSRDLPLRIDYYGDVEDADEIAGNLMYMKASDSYTVPAPVIEADKRAKIPQEYLKRLEKRFSPGLRRRDRRSY